MNHIIYHAYGNEEILCEAAYSILSYFKHNSPQLATINIYTDNPIFFQNIFHQRVNFIFLTPEKIKTWRGEIDFVHRVKIEMLRDFTSTHQGNILYLDTDTFVLSDIKEIFGMVERGDLVMHVDEGRLGGKSNAIMNKTFRFVRRHVISVNDEEIKIPTDTHMWNAGVLGFTSHQADLLEKVLHLTDATYPMFPKHVVEQLAFSYYFQQHSNIIAAEKRIYHYWNFKEFRKVLREYFDAHSKATFDEHLSNVEKLNPKQLIKPKEKFEQQNGLVKRIKKLSGKTWHLADYKFWK